VLLTSANSDSTEKIPSFILELDLEPTLSIR